MHLNQTRNCKQIKRQSQEVGKLSRNQSSLPEPLPKREVELTWYNYWNKRQQTLNKTLLLPCAKKNPQTPTKPPTQATSSLESCSSISKTTIVLNCLKTRHWHYWTQEAGMWHSAHLNAQAGQPLRTPCGLLSEAVFCSEIRTTVWRCQNGFLSKDN